MEPVYLFKLASQKAEWLSVRQAMISRNIANADTPGFKSIDIKPFAAVLGSAKMVMATTQPGHLGINGENARVAGETGTSDYWEISHSGNSVRLEQELMKAGQTTAEYTLQSGIMKSFHRMLLSVARA